jgi:hypothetical protein
VHHDGFTWASLTLAAALTWEEGTMKARWLMVALLLAGSGSASAAGHCADGNSLHEWKVAYHLVMTGHGSPEDDTSGAKLRYYPRT